MRVLHFYKTYISDTHGGVERFIFELINGVNQHGITSDVLSLSTDRKAPTLEMNGHKSHRAYCNFQIASTGFSVSAFERFAKLAKTADIIHYHYPWPFMDIVHFATRIKKPTLVTYHSDIVRQKYLLKIYRPLMRAFLQQIHHIVATSPNYLESSPVLAEFRDKTSVIPLGLNRNAYPVPTSERLQVWQQKITGRFFLFVGILRYYKGLHVLLKALKSLDYPLVIVGSGPEEQALKHQANTLGLKNLHFVGEISDEDKIALLTLCYAFVFPSHLRSEAFGISLVEAAMYAKPLVSCEISTGTSYINQHHRTGIVVPPEDPAALARALQDLWQHPDKALQMGNAAYRRYQDEFTADKMAAAYNKIYRRLHYKID